MSRRHGGGQILPRYRLNGGCNKGSASVMAQPGFETVRRRQVESIGAISTAWSISDFTWERRVAPSQFQCRTSTERAAEIACNKVLVREWNQTVAP